MQNNINSLDQQLAERRVKSAADWFFWIVGFSIINVITIFFNYDLDLLGGLGVTSRAAIIAQKDHASLTGFAAVVVMVAFFALFIVFGYYGRKMKQWAFIGGMIIYLADGLLLALSKDWFGTGFHVLVSIFLVLGFVFLQRYRKMATDKTDHYKV